MQASRSIPFVLFALVSASRIAAQNNGCPNVRASQVDARVEHGGDTSRCGLGVSFLGLGLFGPTCHERTFTYPSHQECKGEPSRGTRCEPAGRLQVKAESCHCVRATVLGTGFLIPSCECHESDDGGEVEDASTVACPIVDPHEH